MNFKEKYGPWALVAGGSDGIGGAFSYEIASKGLNLVITARNRKKLAAVAQDIEQKFKVKVRVVSAELSQASGLKKIIDAVKDLKIGLLVYNAAKGPVAPFYDLSLKEQLDTIAINCSGPLTLVHHFGQAMAKRQKGGIILMSSLSAFQGTPLVATYAATKAFNLILTEGLGYELKQKGVDVLTCCAGPTLTPTYLSSKPDPTQKPSIIEMPPGRVARLSVRHLGKKRVVIPGIINRLSYVLMSRIFTRSLAVKFIGQNMFRLFTKK